MKKYLIYILSVFLLGGCAYRVNPENINSAILPDKNINIGNFMTSKTYSTYDRDLKKITIYDFKKKNGKLEASEVVSYIPFDFYNELYSQFSDVTMTLRNLTHGKFKTLEGALDNEAAKYNYTRLFKNRNEYIIGNDFAFAVQTSIRRYEDMMKRFERDKDDHNILERK